MTRSAFRPRDVALLVLLALTWGHSFLFIKLAVATVAPAWVVTIRMVIGSALLFGCMAFSKDRLPREAKAWGALAVIGTVGAALPWAGQAWAQRSLDTGLVAVLNACAPIMTLAIAAIAGQERLTWNRVFGLTVAVAGSLVVIGGEIGGGRSALPVAVAALVTVGYALGGVLTRRYVSGRIANLPAAAVQLALGAALLGPAAWAVEGPPPFAVAPLAAAALLALGAFGTGLAFLVYFTLIERVGATNTSMVTYLIPIVGLTSGALFRGERFGPNVYAGAAALAAGVWIAQREPRGGG